MAKKSTRAFSIDVLSAIFMLVIGVLLIILKTSAISIAMTVFGVYLIYRGIVDLVSNGIMRGVVLLVVGIAIITCGWVFVAVALYILAIVLLINGIGDILTLVKKNVKLNKINYLSPILMTIAGALLLFAQGDTLSWLFVVVGVLVVAKAILMLIAPIKK